MILKFKGIFCMLYGERSLCIQEHGQVDQEVPNKADV